MKKQILFLICFFIACRGKQNLKPQEEKADISGTETFKTVELQEYIGEIERLGREGTDYIVLGIEAPSFKKLSLEKKLLAYWLSMAAIAGNEIMYLQNHRFSLPIKALLEDVYLATSNVNDKNIGVLRGNLLEYLKYIWINHGQYDHRTSIKFVPGRLKSNELFQLVKLAMERGARLEFLQGKTPEEKLAPLLPHIFDPEFEKRLTVTEKGRDIIAESHVNFYDTGIKASSLEKVDKQWLGRVNVRFALSGGKVVPQVFCANCVYGDYIKRIIRYLEEARKYADEGAFKESIDLLIKFYETGDENYFRRHSIAWIGVNDDVEYVNGFIEQLKDPRGVIGNFEGMSGVKADSVVVDKILADSLYFEEKMPWPQEYKRKRVERATATIVEAVTGTGDMGPVPWGGFNLPNYEDIKKEYGSKNVIFINIINAYSKTEKEKIIEEFFLDSFKGIIKKYSDIAGRLIVYLHEILGHASGIPDPSLKDDPRNIMGRNYSSLEECRADLVALYQMADSKMSEYGIYEKMEREDVVTAAYLWYLTKHLLRLGSLKENIITEAHDKASHLIFQWLLGGKNKDTGVEIVLHNEKHFINITDYEKMRNSIKQLLAILQTAKSTGNKTVQDELFDSLYVDVNLREEISNRRQKLNLAKQKVVVYPHLILVKGKDGKIIDVIAGNDEDLVRQQLRFSGKEINVDSVSYYK